MRWSEASTIVQHELEQDDLFLDGVDNDIVNWNDTHKDHPRSWATWKKLYTTGVIYWVQFGTVGLVPVTLGQSSIVREISSPA